MVIGDGREWEERWSKRRRRRKTGRRTGIHLLLILLRVSESLHELHRTIILPVVTVSSESNGRSDKPALLEGQGLEGQDLHCRVRGTAGASEVLACSCSVTMSSSLSLLAVFIPSTSGPQQEQLDFTCSWLTILRISASSLSIREDEEVDGGERGEELRAEQSRAEQSRGGRGEKEEEKTEKGEEESPGKGRKQTHFYLQVLELQLILQLADLHSIVHTLMACQQRKIAMSSTKKRITGVLLPFVLVRSSHPTGRVRASCQTLSGKLHLEMRVLVDLVCEGMQLPILVLIASRHPSR
eukprot:749276-Hanusia_phi.AAC.4